MKNKYLLLLLIFGLMSSASFAQEKEFIIPKPKKDTALLILPDLIVKLDTVLVVEKTGSLTAKLVKKPLTLFPTYLDYQKYVNRNLAYLDGDEDVKGETLVRFIISKEGYVTEVALLKKLNVDDVDYNVKRTFRNLRKLKPSYNKNNKPINTVCYVKLKAEIIVPKKIYKELGTVQHINNYTNQKLNNGMSFKVCEFNNANANLWITTTAEAKQFLSFSNLEQKDKAKLDNTYSKKAHYIFLMGGGCFGADVKEMQVEIKNDTLNIIWNRPKIECPPTGKVGPTHLYLELDKKQYPNYKKFKVVFTVRE